MEAFGRLTPFHLAIPVHDLAVARQFYSHVLGFEEGRSDKKWVDYNFFGHQQVIHETGDAKKIASNPVDGHEVPIPHFGLVMEWDQWKDWVGKLKTNDIEFLIEPYIRFQGAPGEQATCFFLDPSGNALEFKAFKDPKNLFAR